LFQGTHGEEGDKKKKTRRTAMVASRPIGSVTLEAILAKRNQKPEFRRAQREQAIKNAKDAARTQKAEKKAAVKTKVGDNASPRGNWVACRRRSLRLPRRKRRSR
jgi:large subunit ribosomal protein L24e